jgi:hypothetical protein
MRASKTMNRLLAATVLATLGVSAARARLLIIGNDQEVGLDAQRKPTLSGPGKDSLSIVDGDKVSYDKRDLPTGLFPYNG